MKNDASAIPSEVFGWMENYRFDELTAGQQQVVRDFFDVTEYEEMALAARSLRGAAHIERPKGKETVKKELLEAFERKHASPGSVGLLRMQWGLGKVAALVFVFASLLVVQFLHFRQKTAILTDSIRVDTLLVEAAAPEPVLIRDTVFLREDAPARAKKQEPQYRKTSRIVRPNEIELHITGTDELDRLPNKSKRNSLRQDTLVNKYGFVSM